VTVAVHHGDSFVPLRGVLLQLRRPTSMLMSHVLANVPYMVTHIPVLGKSIKKNN